MSDYAVEVRCDGCNKRAVIDANDEDTLDLLADLWIKHHDDKECEA